MNSFEQKSVARHRPPPILALKTKLSGLVSGTDIVTADGLIPVQHLSEGDRIITRDAGMQRLAWIEALYVTTGAVRIEPSALGHSKPEETLTLPEGQRLLIRDWRAKALYGANVVGVRVARLVDGGFVRSLGPRTLQLYRLGFQRQHTIYGGGLELMAHTTRFAIP
ncbi:MAG: Hint domain-containing protein [Pseudomonadota bacterium]